MSSNDNVEVDANKSLPSPSESTNTNQNEAASVIQTKLTGNNEITEICFEKNKVISKIAPSILITPPSPIVSIASPSPIVSIADDDTDSLKDGNQSFPNTNHKPNKKLNVSCPELRKTDQASTKCSKPIVIKQPDDNRLKTNTVSGQNSTPSKNATNAGTKANSELEMVCQSSSTPIKDISQDSGTKSDDTDCSMQSVEPPSPIAKTRGNMPVIIPQSNRQTSNPIGIANSGHHHGFNRNMFMTPPQDHMGIHGRRPQPDTPYPMAFDMSRGSNPCQLPPTPPSRGHDGMMVGPDGAVYNPHHTHIPPSHSYAQMSSYNEYYPSSESSWTDMSFRSDNSPVPTPNLDNSCYNPYAGGNLGPVDGMPEQFVYPSIYVSGAGLISVLLKNDMSVEMTVDRTIRVVSHNKMMAIATDSRGASACLYHPAAKVYQFGTTTEIATDTFRARMGNGEAITFSNGNQNFKLEESDLQPIAPQKFTDIGRDQSVNLLFSSEGYGESLVASCHQVAHQAEYSNLPKGGVIVRINGVKVTQTGFGDVSVVTGAKFIRLSPNYGTARLGNRFIDIEIEKDWTVKLTRGTHSFVSCRKQALVCNGKMEAGFDENNSLKVVNLAPRHPLIADNGMMRRPPPRKPAKFFGPPPINMRRRPDFAGGFGRGMGRGGF